MLEFVVRGVAHALAGSDKLAQVDELELPIAFLVGAFSHARFVDHWDLFLVDLGARRAAHATAFAVRETRCDRALFPQPPRALARPTPKVTFLASPTARLAASSCLWLY